MKSGFTLIELLIVIGIIGILAAVVLVGIDPVDKLAQARDTERKTAIGHIATAMEEYAVTHNGTYPDTDPASSNWIVTLVNVGALKISPKAVPYTTGTLPCSAVYSRNQNNYCMDAETSVAPQLPVVYTTLESKSVKSRCASGTYALFLWAAGDGRAGVVCGSLTGWNGSGRNYTYLQ